jgi:hypothetical protein
MIKKRYFTISAKGRYGMEEPLFRFENLDGAMEMFKYLMQGKAVKLESHDVPDITQTPDDDGYVSSVYIHVEKGEPEYHLGSENVDVYTQEEYEQLKKERNEWKDSFKKEKPKKAKK